MRDVLLQLVLIGVVAAAAPRCVVAACAAPPAALPTMLRLAADDGAPRCCVPGCCVPRLQLRGGSDGDRAPHAASDGGAGGLGQALLASGIAESLSEREVRRVSVAAAIGGLRQKESEQARALELTAPGGDTDVLSGWDPSTLRQFRAGRMVVEADGQRLRALPDKGVLYLETSDSDGFIHLMWTPRETATPTGASAGSRASPLDLLLMAGDTVFSRVLDFNGHAVTSARVYALTYADGEVFYFWMQEPAIEPDDVLFNRVLHALEPPRYDESKAQNGWTWQSHILESVRLGLHLALQTPTGDAAEPQQLPAGYDDPSWWEQRAAALERVCYLHWLPRGKDEALARGHDAVQKVSEICL